MPISYPSASERSFTSFFTVTLRLLFWRGGVIPYILPQCLIFVAYSIVLVLLYDHGYLDALDDVSIHLSALMFLIAFLTVFKTQTAYNQYWTAANAYYQTYAGLRALARRAAVLGSGERKEHLLRRIFRYEILLIRVTRKSLATSGITGRYCHEPFLVKIENLVRELCSETEYALLSKRPVENQSDIVFHWILVLVKALGIDNPPTLGLLAQIENNLQVMEMIDTEQFPFPYYQLVKVHMLFFVASFPSL